MGKLQKLQKKTKSNFTGQKSTTAS
ncbi:uncharacterized protein METZ01_LOCUS483213 [marine metagenome]|uniref:Uncharacterized protein n=1 Tax=marine metagenome TaxID=408172 RepID=A0A383CE93_9ZZZZ